MRMLKRNGNLYVHYMQNWKQTQSQFCSFDALPGGLGGNETVILSRGHRIFWLLTHDALQKRSSWQTLFRQVGDSVSANLQDGPVSRCESTGRPRFSSRPILTFSVALSVRKVSAGLQNPGSIRMPGALLFSPLFILVDMLLVVFFRAIARVR